jgi:hypothetical protein
MEILEPVETTDYTRKTKDALLATIRAILKDNLESNEEREG